MFSKWKKKDGPLKTEPKEHPLGEEFTPLRLTETPSMVGIQLRKGSVFLSKDTPEICPKDAAESIEKALKDGGAEIVAVGDDLFVHEPF